MNVPKKPQFSEEDLGLNPNVGPLQIPVYEHISKIEFVTNPENPYGPKIQKAVLLETTPKTTLYITPAHRKLTNQLSKSSKELFLWILYELDSNQQYLWINRERFMKECNISSINSYKSAIEGLIQYVFLTPSIIKDVYWINPSLYFRGSRVTKYPDNLIITNKTEEVIQDYIDNNI